MRRVFVLLLAALSFNCSAEDMNAERLVADGAVGVFYDGCIHYYPDPAAFEAWVAKNHFDLIPPEFSTGLSKEPGGKSYSVNNNGVRYLLVAEAGNLCTLFVKEVNLEYARAAFSKVRMRLTERGLKESYRVREKDLSRGHVTHTEYQYKDASGDSVWIVVVSESTSTKGLFQLAMSVMGNQRADQLQTTPYAVPGEPTAPFESIETACSGAPATAQTELPSDLKKWAQLSCTKYGHVLRAASGWVWHAPQSNQFVRIWSQRAETEFSEVGHSSYFTLIEFRRLSQFEAEEANQTLATSLGVKPQPVSDAYLLAVTNNEGRMQTVHFIRSEANVRQGTFWGWSCSAPCAAPVVFMGLKP